MPEWPKGAACKVAGSAYGGSNPPPPTDHRPTNHGVFSALRSLTSRSHSTLSSAPNGHLAGAGADLDVVPLVGRVVVGALPVGLPPGAADGEVVDRELRCAASDAHPHR